MTKIQIISHISTELSIYLDGRDAPVSNAWVDRSDSINCLMHGNIEYLPNEKCYYKPPPATDSGYVSIPTAILLNQY
jgi:hypothetical protein